MSSNKIIIGEARGGLDSRIGLYWKLIKSPQTALLLATGLAGFLSARNQVSNWPLLLSLACSLFLAISGSTILNMWYDRDIDAKMSRTCTRPLPEGQISSREAFTLGLILGLAGVAWALTINWLFGLIVFAGIFFDVIVYTLWLKRRTAWSVIWGGIAGAMPVLAGRALGAGQIEWVGLLLAASVVFWIPTHILTFSMRYHDDYQRASIPTFPSTYGFRATRLIIAISSVLAAGSMALAAYGVGLTAGMMGLLLVLSTILFFLALSSALRPSERKNFGLFKYASMYMLCAMLLMAVEAY